MKEQVYITRNHVPVYFYSSPSLHSFCIGLYVKAGVLYEEKGQNGISHFLEHILFRNLNHTMNGALYETLDRLGLDFNGSTYKELIQFKITGSPRHFSQACRLITRFLEPLCLPASYVDVERKRIKAEIRENNDLHSLDFYGDRLVWEDSPLSMPIAGSPSSLNHIHKSSLEQFRKKVFSPGRFHFYVTGAFSPQDISLLCSFVEKACLTDSNLRSDNQAPLPASFGKRKPSLFLKKARYCYARFSFDFFTGRHNPAALDYLYDLLFSGDSSLAYSMLSEQTGYVYSFDPCLEKYKNAGCLTLSFGASSQNFLPALKTAFSMFCRIREELPDLSRVRPTYTDNLPMLLDQPEQLNWIGGYENHILDLKDSSLSERQKRYEAVTPTEIKQGAREIFQKENLCLAVKAAGNAMTEEILQKVIFSSGL